MPLVKRRYHEWAAELQLSRFHILSNQLILAQEANFLISERLDGFPGGGHRFEHAV